MNCSWARVGVAKLVAPRAASVAASAKGLSFIGMSPLICVSGMASMPIGASLRQPLLPGPQHPGGAASMGEGPQAQLLLAHAPQLRQAMRLDDQEEHDERSEEHTSELQSREKLVC